MANVESANIAVSESATKSKIFEIQDYCICDNMFKYFKEEQFCDVRLKSGKDGKIIPIHRIVLCSANDYFSTLLTIEMREKYQSEIELENLYGDILLNIIEFCYTGKIEINEENVDGLVAAADMLHFVNLKKKCTEYYHDHLDITNCLGIIALSEQYGLDELQTTAYKLAFDYFVEVTAAAEFEHLPFDNLLKLISSDDVNVDTEEDVFNAVIKWIEFDLKGRQIYVRDLIKAVRVGHIRNSFLHSSALRWLKKIGFCYLHMAICDRKLTELIPARTSTFFGRLFAVAGSLRNKGITMERYCPRLDSWKVIHSIPENRHYFRSVQKDNLLLIIGGSNKERCLDSMNCFDLTTLSLTKLQPMISMRWCFSTVVLDKTIYVLGGKIGDVFMKSTERYDTESDTWTELAPMSSERSFAAAANLSGIIFVMGGRDATNWHRSVEYYLPHSNKWVFAAPMQEERTAAMAGVVDGFLYVLGGTHRKASSSIERYDPKEDKWTMMTFAMKIPRRGFGLTLLEDWAYIAGGIDDKSIKLNSFEKLNLKTGESVLLSPMNTERNQFDICHFGPLDGIETCC